MPSSPATLTALSTPVAITPEITERASNLRRTLGIDSRSAMYCVLADRGQLRFLTTGVPNWLSARRDDVFSRRLSPRLAAALDHYMPGWRWLTPEEMDFAWHFRNGTVDPSWTIDYRAAMDVESGDGFNPEVIPGLDRFRAFDRAGKLPMNISAAFGQLWPEWNKRKRAQNRGTSGRFGAEAALQAG